MNAILAAIPEGITFAIAIVGAVLGILNTWRAFDRDRIRVRVRPKNFLTDTGAQGMCFEIVNSGYLPVTITQVGITLRLRPKQELVFIPRTINGGSLPQRLEPRTHVTLILPPGTEKDPMLGKGLRAYACTACGRTFYGNSPALQGRIKEVRAALQAANKTHPD